MISLKSQQEYYDLFISELQARSPGLTDTNHGSQIDTLAGATSIAISELQNILIDNTKKTFFATANGPEITAGSDDLETLAVDHFGTSFLRPAASQATGIVTFSRVNAHASGQILISAGTIVKTAINPNGVSERFQTTSDVALIGDSINVQAIALVAGSAGNVAANSIKIIETTLSNLSVTNLNAFAGGAEEQTDAQYRETIKNKIASLTGATLEAIQAAALTVTGVSTSTAIENELVVIEYDIATSRPKAGSAYFRIPQVILYIADANGSANPELIASTSKAINKIRAAGVKVNVLAATAFALNWTGSIILNPASANYAVLSTDTSRIREAMKDYLSGLPIGTGLMRANANAAILAIFGPDGTNDILDFNTTVPSGDVPISANQKLIPGKIGLS